MRWTERGAVGALIVSAVGCGGEVIGPLDGSWMYKSDDGSVRSITVTLNDDGTAEEVLDLGRPSALSPGYLWRGCSGTATLTGYSWAATSTKLTLSGTPSCSGAITCDGTTQACSFPIYPAMVSGLDPNSQRAGTQVAGACAYSLSDNGTTLSLDHCTPTIEVPPPVVTTPAPSTTDQLFSYTLRRSS